MLRSHAFLPQCSVPPSDTRSNYAVPVSYKALQMWALEEDSHDEYHFPSNQESDTIRHSQGSRVRINALEKYNT